MGYVALVTMKSKLISFGHTTSGSKESKSSNLLTKPRLLPLNLLLRY